MLLPSEESLQSREVLRGCCTPISAASTPGYEAEHQHGQVTRDPPASGW